MYKAYAGIGSRKTPKKICELMTRIATRLESDGYVLRSGGADRADKAFEDGAKSLREIYLPWRGFNGSNSSLCNPSPQAYSLARDYHPNWLNLSQAVKALMARNVHQVLGMDLSTPSKFIICWTADGGISGGTGQAMRIAKAYDIPIYNMHDPRNVELMLKYVEM